MAIRYDKKLNQEINRVIKNFNQKITRLEKEERDLLLPSKISKKQLKQEVYTRADLKRKLKELQRFSKRGVEETITTQGGLKISKYEFEELKRESIRLKRNISREIARLVQDKVKIAGVEQVATFAQMGSRDYLNLVARRKALEKDIGLLSKEEYERYRKLVEKTGKNKQYMNNIFKQNYFDMLSDLGYYFGYDNNKLEEIKKALMKLNPRQFLKLFNSDRAISSILDYYPIVTGNFTSINPSLIREDVKALYDTLYENIDEIVENYA